MCSIGEKAYIVGAANDDDRGLYSRILHQALPRSMTPKADTADNILRKGTLVGGKYVGGKVGYEVRSICSCAIWYYLISDARSTPDIQRTYDILRTYPERVARSQISSPDLPTHLSCEFRDSVGQS